MRRSTFNRLVFATLVLVAVGNAAAAEPAFNCAKASGSVEKLICGDDALAAADRKMAEVFSAAQRKAGNEHPSVLKAEQRGWIKGRNDCWKNPDARACVNDEYLRRIAELQARYRLVDMRGPFFFACDGNRANELVITHFSTEPPTLIAERGDQASLMFAQPAASGSRYQGRNESFWEHHGEATVVWGYGAPEMICRLRSGTQ